MAEVTQLVSGKARSVWLLLTQALAYLGPSDDIPHWGRFLEEQKPVISMSLPSRGALGKRCQKEDDGGQEGGPEPTSNVTRQEDNGCLRVQGQVGGRSSAMPRGGSARPGRLLASGASTPVSLASGVFISRARPGVVSRWGSVEITRSHTHCLSSCPWPFPGTEPH